MSKIKVFISYSNRDKHFAGNIVDCFERCVGFEMFLAHDDLYISDNFSSEIIKHLQNTDYVIPLISKNFLISSYANQEIGIAFEKKKKIIPISIDGTDPKGFIDHLQAFKCEAWDKEAYINAATQIFLLAFKHPRYIQFKEKALESILHAFCRSDHFIVTSATLRILIELNSIIKFNDEQIGQIVAAAKTNRQIYSATLLFPKLVEFLHINYGINIDN